MIIVCAYKLLLEDLGLPVYTEKRISKPNYIAIAPEKFSGHSQARYIL